MASELEQKSVKAEETQRKLKNEHDSEHQHVINARLQERLDKVWTALRSDRLKSATKHLRKGETIL